MGNFDDDDDDDDDDNNNNNNSNNSNICIQYYWLNFDQHWHANRITGGLCAVCNVGYSHVPTLPSPTGLSHHSNFAVLC